MDTWLLGNSKFAREFLKFRCTQHPLLESRLSHQGPPGLVMKGGKWVPRRAYRVPDECSRSAASRERLRKDDVGDVVSPAVARTCA
jgi:hypothetical protein